MQFLPLHPQPVFNLQKELDIITAVPPYKFYKIPIRELESNKAIVFFKTAPGEENTSVKWLEDVSFESLQNIPEATVEYYKSVAETGEPPFNYQFIPHILYKGSVDISWAKLVTLSD